MTMLENHLEQIGLSARSIADLHFPPPKMFTNAMLGNHEITTLIRDTEPHEHALFSLDPSAVHASSHSSKHNSIFSGSDNGGVRRRSLYASSEPRKESTVARVLGSDILQEIRRSSGHTRSRNGAASGMNVEVLLTGAEKLCAVYPVPGASEKIASLRSRNRDMVESIRHYEEKVAKQQVELHRLNTSLDYRQDPSEEGSEHAPSDQSIMKMATEQDLEMEEQEIRELEAKKYVLEERVSGIQKDLGGLMR